MARTHEEYVALVNSVNPNVEVIGTYTKAHDRIATKCKICGYEWNPKAYYLTEGLSCRYCSAKRGAINNKGKTGLKTHDKFVSEMAKKHPQISVISEYVTGHTKIKVLCDVCNHQWSVKPYSLLQGHGCPRCAKSGTSFMEQFIRSSFIKVLGEENVLSRDKIAIGMELDIYIPSLKLAIEPGNWFLHKKSIMRDEQKREKCTRKGIRLITIYDKFPKGEKKPFESDCYTFEEDLNKADHTIISKLVIDIFNSLGIRYLFEENDWQEIEMTAYENAKAKTHKDFIVEMKQVHPSIVVLEEYRNINKRVLVKCDICNFQWRGVPGNMLAGDGCRKCGTKVAHAKFVKAHADFVEQVKLVLPDVEIIGEYTGRHNPVKTKCQVCGHIWEPRASSLLRGSNHKGWKTIHKNLKDNCRIMK